LHAFYSKVDISVKAVHFKILQLEFFVSFCSLSKLFFMQRSLVTSLIEEGAFSKMWHLCSFTTNVAFFSSILPTVVNSRRGGDIIRDIEEGDAAM